MLELSLVGIGTGNPEHLTLQAVRVLNQMDAILIPRKGKKKDELAEVRRGILADILDNPATRIIEFDLPVRNPEIVDYQERVNAWHDEIAKIWLHVLQAEVGTAGKAAFLIWGDPGLYDSSLRIASRLQSQTLIKIEVVPGITAIQGLTASHNIPLNELAEPFLVTTGRQLRERGWPKDVETVVVMLDGENSFQFLTEEALSIWWGAYVGMDKEITLSGPLEEMGDQIIEQRNKAREVNGWVMDIYILRRT
ncbi:precorrin-6A synthase (deacetylating) [Sneathiella aquimaris]|uniref:precorrin-6A synthase (deacetylating) n=1 Tax=Sneathiella aquimaris TaxID=2599305 RepID=UPI00146A7ED0|nr:precorrin-6A synthase (deacetylating) [Sneathiella aquimaris]